MKRSFGAREGSVEMESSVHMATTLMLLSRGNAVGGGGVGEDVPATSTPSPVRVFECKTCNRQFPSFQALGGHRASHKKPRHAAAGTPPADVLPAAPRPRVHECAVCGLEFSVGQALGGHMRRHRAVAPAPAETVASGEEKRQGGLSLDLNLTPVENDAECRGGRAGIGLRLVDRGMRMVDCSY